jgi:MFS transporter, DHA1 family, multidrug resistance protein
LSSHSDGNQTGNKTTVPLTLTAQLRGALPRTSVIEPKLIVILGALTAFASLSIDMYLPSFPTLERELHANSTTVQFSLAAFFIGLAVGQAVWGPLADRYGRKRPLYIGISVYVIASIGCALAKNIETLIAFRFIQALGGCAGIVIARAMVRDLFDHKTLARVFSLLTLVLGVAPILAPVAGGYILNLFGWRWIFVILTFFGIACLTAAAIGLTETLPPEARHRSGGNPIWAALKVYGQLLVDPRFIGYALAGGVAQAGLFAYIANSPFVFIKIYGVKENIYGWFFGFNALGLIVSSQINHRLLSRWTSDQILSRIIVVMTFFSMTLLLMAWTGWGGFWSLIPPLFGFVSCLGFTFPNAIAGALAHQEKRAGSASALLGTIQFSLATVAGSLVGAFHPHSAVPMAAVMALCCVLALTLHRTMVRPVSDHPPVEDGMELDVQVVE